MKKQRKFRAADIGYAGTKRVPQARLRGDDAAACDDRGSFRPAQPQANDQIGEGPAAFTDNGIGKRPILRLRL